MLHGMIAILRCDSRTLTLTLTLGVTGMHGTIAISRCDSRAVN